MPITRFKSSVFGATWPAVPSAEAAQVLALQAQLEQSQWLSASALRDAQFSQLQGLLRFCLETVPFYRTHWQGQDFSALTPERWRDIPLLPRRALQGAGNDLCSQVDIPSQGKRQKITTSGSTGRPVEVMSTALTRMFWRAFVLREHFWHGRDFSAKLAAIRSFKHIKNAPAEGLRGDNWGTATKDLIHTGPSAMFDLTADLSQQAAWLLRESPAYLLAHPSTLLGLAHYYDKNALALTNLREVRSIGETLPDEVRAVCRRVWGVPLVDLYSCQEMGYLAVQCPQHEHYHVQSENVLLEVLDDAGNECQPSQVGRVVVTSLHNWATPMIRYEIGDYAQVGAPCACGRGLPVLQRILGRARNLLTLPSGERRWPRLGFGAGLLAIAPIEQIQLIQQTPQAIDVRLVVLRPLTLNETQNLSAFILKNLAYPFTLRFEFCAELRPAANGKMEQFISMVGP